MLFSSFLTLLLVSFAVAYHFTRPRTSRKNARKSLALIHAGPADAAVELVGAARKPQRLAQAVDILFARFQSSRKLADLILHAGRTETPGTILLLSAALALIAGVLVFLLAGALVPSFIAALVFAMAPVLWLRHTRNKRLKNFEQALPDAIDLMARALQAGHSSPSSIEIIAEQSSAPLSDEFGRCFQQQKFGIPFRQALLELGQRIPSRDLSFLITAILVQKETGGDLTQILNRASSVIRDRIRIEGEIRGYTAQGRLTGHILTGLPIVLLALISLFTPSYIHVLFADPLGHRLLYVGLGFILIGSFFIRNIVNVKV